MKKILLISGILFTVILGTLLHFTYAWSGEKQIVGYFSAISESTWEHLKLLFFPMLLFSVLEFFLAYRKSTTFIPARAIAILSGMLWIITLFYTITGIVGKADLPITNILIFLTAVAFAFWMTQILLKRLPALPRYYTVMALVVLVVFILAFILWSYDPPDIGLFADPSALQTIVR